ncbi:MAG: hypothetical protein GEU79_03815 [Acidimicrobiia bacterium]|nr:hypothetical protein [Acidimicrobiia bacterium]
MSRFTHLGRIVDLRLLTTRLSLVLVSVWAVVGYLNEGWAGVFDCGVAAVLGWMLARELDPDHPWIAVLVAALAGAPGLVGVDVGLRATLIVIASARLMVRSTGLAAKLTDIFVVGAVAVAWATGPGGWAVGMGLAVAIALDAGTDRTRLGLAALIGLGVTAVGALTGGVTSTWSTPTLVHLGVVVAGLGATAIARPRPLQSVGDYTGEVLDPTRLSIARIIVVGAATLAALAGGGSAVGVTSVIWITVTVVGVASRLRPSFRG